ncbi:MAG: pyridoxal-5'-phosphate-dependent protein subunit beta, partial [Moorellaceae bacterium]
LEKRTLEITDFVLERWFRDIFLRANEEHIYDFRKPEAKERLFAQKEADWLPFGYSKEYLDSMRSPSFWEEEYAKIKEYDEKIRAMR